MPRLQRGFGSRVHASVGLPLIAGSTDRTGSGNLRTELFVKALDEGSLLPALAVAGSIDFPTGKSAEGLDTSIRPLATKTPGERPGTHPVHLNAIRFQNEQPRAGERSNSGRMVFGYSTPVAPETVLVADLAHGRARTGNGISTVLEVGIRQAWGRDMALTPGLARDAGTTRPGCG